MSLKIRLKPISRQTIVVTGALSTVGQAVARRAARAGARVFLIGSDEDGLRALCETLQDKGARAAFAVAEGDDAEALETAADACGRLFGGFDTWVNSEGVPDGGAPFETTLDDHRHRFDAAYDGLVNGSLAALRRLREREGGGAIVNVGSALSDAPFPVEALHEGARRAVRDFTVELRRELRLAGDPVSISLVKPAGIDTDRPYPVRDLTGGSRPVRPVYAADVAADVVLHCAAHPISEITVGGSASLLSAFHSTFPEVAEPLMARLGPWLRRRPRRSNHQADGGYYDPTEDGLYDEVDYPMLRRSSLFAQARMHPRVAGGGLAAIMLAVVAAVLLNQRSGPTRYERIRERIDPRNWGRPRELTDRLSDWGGRVGRDANRWFREAADAFPSEEIESRARDAGRFARDHAREGGALLALGLIAAAVAAVVLERSQSEQE